MHLRQSGFTYSVFGPFTYNKGKTQNFKETRESKYIYQNKLDNKVKLTFNNKMACEDFKDLSIRATSDILLRDKAFNIARNPKYVGYQRGLASIV